MKRSFKHILFAGILATSFFLTSCGSTASSTTSADTTASKSDTATTILKIGATPVPHEEILEQAIPLLAEKGIELKITSFSDYPQVNPSTADGSLDANYFQTVAYLDEYNTQNNETLVNVGGIHFEPMGIYPGKISAVSELTQGSKVGIPNDVSNQARALRVLAKQGVIKLKDEDSLTASILDITENPNEIELIELAADQIPATLPDLDLGVINGNYALGANIADKVLADDSEDPISAKEYANIIVVKEENKDDEAIKELLTALKSDTIKKFIDDTYKGTVVAVN